jgi:hypothetical protein
MALHRALNMEDRITDTDINITTKGTAMYIAIAYKIINTNITLTQTLTI